MYLYILLDPAQWYSGDHMQIHIHMLRALCTYLRVFMNGAGGGGVGHTLSHCYSNCVFPSRQLLLPAEADSVFFSFPIPFQAQIWAIFVVYKFFKSSCFLVSLFLSQSFSAGYVSSKEGSEFRACFCFDGSKITGDGSLENSLSTF